MNEAAAGVVPMVAAMSVNRTWAASKAQLPSMQRASHIICLHRVQGLGCRV